MTSITLRLSRALVLAGSAALAMPTVAFAHTGVGASPLHIITEVGLWGLGVVATLGLVTTIFWARANWIRRRRS